MIFRLFFIFTLIINTRAEYPIEIQELMSELHKDIFNEEDFSKIKEVLNTPSQMEIEAFVEALESSDDPAVIRAFLSSMNSFASTAELYTEVVRKRLKTNPESLRAMLNTLNIIKGEMKQANLKFPKPEICAVGIGFYIGSQAWLLSKKSSFYDSEYLDDIYKEEVYKPNNFNAVGLAASACMADLFYTTNKSLNYFEALKENKLVEVNREFYLQILEDLKVGRIAYSYNRKRIEVASFYDQYSDQVINDLVTEAKLNTEKSRKLRHSLKELFRGYLNHMKSKRIQKELEKIKEEVASTSKKTQKLYSFFEKEFSEFLSSYRYTKRWEIILEVQNKFDETIKQTSVVRPFGLKGQLCFMGMGSTVALLGLHAAAGRDASILDDQMTKVMREHYQENQNVISAALVSPCLFFGVERFSNLIRSIRLDESKYLLKKEELRLIKEAAMNAQIKPQGHTRFTSVVQIIDNFYSHRTNPNLAKELPSKSCLDKIIKMDIKLLSLNSKSVRTIASSQSFNCRGSLKRIFRKRRVFEPDLSVSFERIGQFVSYNKLSELILDLNEDIDDPYFKIKRLAADFCKEY